MWSFKNITAYKYKKYFLLLSVSVAFLVSLPVLAATLFISPSSSTQTVGDIFSARVYVSSEDQAMNAVSGVFVFPNNLVRVISISQTGAIIPFWIKNPTFSNSYVTFEGIVPNPGFTGSNGKILTINLKAAAAGVAQLNFSSAEILANDGLGTSILGGTVGSTITIYEEEYVPPDDNQDDDDQGDDDQDDGGQDGDDQSGDGDTSSGSGGVVPSAPVLLSPTHSDQNAWYRNKIVMMKWSVTTDIEAVRVSASQDPLGEPDKEYSVIDEKEISIDDGIRYIHVQLKNSAGWGVVSHYRVQIDTQAPSRIKMKRIVTDGKLGTFSTDFVFDVQDIPSGIDYFEIAIDGEEPVIWRDDGSHVFHVSKMRAGKHVFVVKAYDRAGNEVSLREVFVLTPFDPIGVGEIMIENKDRVDEKPEIPLPEVVTPEIVSVVSYAGFGVGLGQVLVLASNAAGFTDLWFLLLRFISFVSSFFRRRRGEPWGVVYDSVTKRPLDPAYVVISSAGEQKGVAITDLDGRYGFLVAPGQYVIEANKTHYVFPSERLRGRKMDEFYDNLYFGEPIEVTDSDKGLIRYNIPLDPVDFDWNEFAKKEQGLFRLRSRRKKHVVSFISNIIFFAGFVLSTYILWYQPTTLNFVIFGIYAGILIFQTFWKVSHPITQVMRSIAKEVVPFAVVKAYLAGNDALVKTVVADDLGQFYLLTPPGEYYFTVEVKQPDGSYSKKYQTKATKLREGVVLKNLYVNKG